jgi:hypothetical protein
MREDTNMKKSEIIDLIYAGLNGLVAEHGFRLNRKQEAFVRRIRHGKQCIVVPLVAHHPAYLFSLTLTTRLDAVEEIFNAFSGSPAKYHSLTVTAITQLDYFTKKPKTEYSVAKEADISDAVDDLSPIIRTRILPFLNEHQDIAAWDKAVNSAQNDVCGDSSLLADRCSSVDNSNQPYRGMHAIILARLAGNSDFENIVGRLRARYGNWMEAADKLTRLADYLRRQ